MQPADKAIKQGQNSLKLLLVQIACIALFFLIAPSMDNRGHIPASAILALFVMLGLFVLSPIGLALGISGFRGATSPANRKALVGLIGNSLIALLVMASLIIQP